VFTTARVPDALLDLLRQSSCLVQRLLTFTELNLDFMAIEERIFSLDYPNALEMLFAPGSAAGHDDDDGAALPGWASAWDARPAALQPPPGACSDMVQRIAQNLLTLCHLLGEVPTIRYQRSESGVAQSIAEALLDAIRDYEANVPGGMRGAQLQAAAVEQNASTAAAPSEDKSSAGTSTNTMLLILDRSVDMVAPFLHEYTYQAMCNASSGCAG
jgi:syntaxin-binding protein 1